MPALLTLDAALDAVADAAWRAQKQREVADLIARLRGPVRRGDRRRLPVAPGGDVEVTATARRPLAGRRHAGRGPLPVAAARSRGRQAARAKGSAATRRAKRTVKLPADAAALDAVLARDAARRGLYTVARSALIGLPERAPPLVGRVRLHARRPHAHRRARRSATSGPIRSMGERYRAARGDAAGDRCARGERR